MLSNFQRKSWAELFSTRSLIWGKNLNPLAAHGHCHPEPIEIALLAVSTELVQSSKAGPVSPHSPGQSRSRVWETKGAGARAEASEGDGVLAFCPVRPLFLGLPSCHVKPPCRAPGVKTPGVPNTPTSITSLSLPFKLFISLALGKQFNDITSHQIEERTEPKSFQPIALWWCDFSHTLLMEWIALYGCF